MINDNGGFLHCVSQKEGRKSTLKGEGVQVPGPWTSGPWEGSLTPWQKACQDSFGELDGLGTWVGLSGSDPRSSPLHLTIQPLHQVQLSPRELLRT